MTESFLSTVHVGQAERHAWWSQGDVAAALGARKPEGEALLGAWERTCQSGGAVVLHGPSGVGQQEVLQRCVELWARHGRSPAVLSTATRQQKPYQVIHQAILAVLNVLDGRGEGQAVRQRHAQVLRLLEGTATGSSRLALFEALRALVDDVLQTSGGILALGRLEDADHDTRAALRFIAEHGESTGGVLCLSVDEDAHLGPWAAEMGQLPRATPVRLGGLDKEGLLRWLKTSSVMDRLLQTTRGRLSELEDVLEALPLDAGSLLDERLAALSPHARTVGLALSLCELPLGLDALVQMTGLNAPVLAPVLQKMTEAGLLRKHAANGALLFALAKPTHAARLQQSLAPQAARALHLALGNHLESRGAGMMEDGAAHLAEHLLAAGDADRGVAYALQAAERLTLGHAYGAALDLVIQALEITADSTQRVELLNRGMELHRLRGDLKKALRCAGLLKRHLDPDGRDALRVRVAELLTEMGRPGAAISQLGRARSAEAGAVDAALAEAHYLATNAPEAAVHARAALGAAHASETTRFRARNTLGKLALAVEDWAGAASLFEENLQRARVTTSRTEELRAQINLGVVAFRKGDEAQAELQFTHAMQLAEEITDLPHQAFCALNLGALHQQRNSLGQALSLHHRALGLFSKMGNRSESVRAGLNAAYLHGLLGETERATQLLAQAERLAQEGGLSTHSAYAWAVRGHVAQARGQLAEATEHHRQAAMAYAQAHQPGRAGEQWLHVAEVALRRTDLAVVDEALRQVEVMGTLEHARLRAARLVALARRNVQGRGDLPEAAQWLQQARGSVAAPVDDLGLALVCLAEGDLWRARGDGQRADKLTAQGKDHLHKVAQGLPAQLRDGFVRSQLAVLSLVTPPVRTLGQAMPPTPASSILPTRHEVPEADPRAGWKDRYDGMVGQSPALMKVFARLDRLAGTTSTVLIRGESGTGKELVAAALHRLSPRADGPFVKVNCAALVETLLLSELFGHEKGAFTGAHTRKAGRFEVARGGTIFLDEIGDISPQTQVALLRVLQERVFERVGGTTPLKADCRVLCATNRDLEAMVKAGTFREDLYYRLKGVVVELPALRERSGDIPLMVRHVVQAQARELNRPAPRVTDEAMTALCRHSWPGNVRELENTVRSLVLFAEESIGVEHLLDFKELGRASTHTAVSAPSQAAELTGGVPLGAFKKKLEFEAISRALVEAEGNISRAAGILQMKRPRLSQIVNGDDRLRSIKARYRGADQGGDA